MCLTYGHFIGPTCFLGALAHVCQLCFDLFSIELVGTSWSCSELLGAARAVVVHHTDNDDVTSRMPGLMLHDQETIRTPPPSLRAYQYARPMTTLIRI